MTIVITLAGYGLKLEDCHEQSYDNAPNMSECYASLQALIMQVNSLVIYMACAAHSLNLFGSSAVELIREAVIFLTT